METIQKAARRMMDILGLDGPPVGVRLLGEGVPPPEGVERLQQHRYCQALMRARRSRHVLLDGGQLACPAAAAAFGFRPLTEALRSRKGLVGFGIVSDPAVGHTMFEGMPRLEPGRVSLLHLYALDEARQAPDLVVVEDETEKLMWIALASLHAAGGRRLQGSTAVLQAVCVDSTIIPFLEDRLNFGLGCYGCREATDIAAGETVVGFPARLLQPIVEHLEFLAKRAMPNCRQKKALNMLERRDTV